MNKFLSKRVLVWLSATLGVGVILGAVASTGTSDVTRARLERSLPTTFANAYVQQAAILGHSGITVASLDAKATCDKGGPHVADHGAGADWICYMAWNDPAVDASLLPGKFELNTHTNDCYTATGPSKIVGLLTISDARGRDVRNPVHEFDGCFDPKSSNDATGTDLHPPPATPSIGPAALTLPTGTVAANSRGVVHLRVSCSAGGEGCGGTITARLRGTPLGSTMYAIASGQSGTVTFGLDIAQRRQGGQLELAATPVIGAVVTPHVVLRVGAP